MWPYKSNLILTFTFLILFYHLRKNIPIKPLWDHTENDFITKRWLDHTSNIMKTFFAIWSLLDVTYLTKTIHNKWWFFSHLQDLLQIKFFNIYSFECHLIEVCYTLQWIKNGDLYMVLIDSFIRISIKDSFNELIMNILKKL